MLPTKAARALTAWIAIAALLMAALAPSLSRAFAPAGAMALQADVCSVAADMRDAEDGAPASRGAHPLEHCPYCTLHADGVAIPAAAQPTALLTDLRDGPPVAFLAAPRTPHAWVSAQPRAPPRFV